MKTVQQRQRERLRINGTVQGVGFRPFVYRLACEMEIGGFVVNRSDGVTIEIEGPPTELDEFISRLREELPPAARIHSLTRIKIDPRGESRFEIAASERHQTADTCIPPDLAVCNDCLREMNDPRDRRFRYPFINCTNCGPRCTIVSGIPYDRPFTSMARFEMCAACALEYNDPANRRFHAQPIACPECGPTIWLHDGRDPIETTDPTSVVVDALRSGQIVALRGLGGFHLAVNALNDEAVCRLRERKHRWEKPLAMMAPDVLTIRRYCDVTSDEESALRAPSAPIVLLGRRTEENKIARSVVYDNRYYGFMLPYTPLHHLIINGNFEALVMTSGNLSEEPIAIDNAEALERLKGIADLFLLHDRDILQRCDDSIVRAQAGKRQVIRRARGFVPEPIHLAVPVVKPILACGGELKNTIALARGDQVFMSQHIGDLDNPSAMEFFEHCIRHLSSVMEISPDAIACDLHPEYLSTKWAQARRDLPVIHVQHHHAHMASLMAEHGIAEPIVGLILDGTGFGTDGTIWGGEVLVGDAADFSRYAWLEPVPLPGGAAAIREPWRMALSYLKYAYKGKDQLPLPAALTTIPEISRDTIVRMIDSNLNCPLTSSCGRLFDGVAALLGLRLVNAYEAQAAISLEMAAHADGDIKPFEAIDEHRRSAGNGPIRFGWLIREVIERKARGEATSRIAAGFHASLAELLIPVVEHAAGQLSIGTIGLSGGVFQNALFLDYIYRRLQQTGLRVLVHEKVPTNDGGLALGQIACAAAKLKAPVKGRA